MRTSEERREVAATMRAISCRGVGDLTLGEVLNSILTGGAPRPTTETAILARLADLIDPTFRITCKGSFTARHDFTRWECGKCGAYAFTPRGWIAPRYCPNCGERLARDDD
ncbi:hypothetical protein ACTM8Z_00105 [Atopobiaceae bacterium HCP3S3_D6]